MALIDMQVFSEFLQTSLTETLDQQVDKFNAATNNGIILRAANHEGDYTNEALYAKVSGLVRRRNAYGSGAVAAKVLSQLLNSTVKVGAGTPPVDIPPDQFKWLQKSPEEAGVVLGAQLAGDMLQDMLNIAIGAYVAAVKNVGATLVSTTTGGATLAKLNTGAALFGDASQELVAWVMHSKSLHEIYGTALANSERLFQFGNVQVISDGFGRPLVITDSPQLINTVPIPDQYHTLGFSRAGILVDQNGDFTDTMVDITGDENIKRQYQAEWSYNLGLKGYAWDQASGGKSPNDAALIVGTNWDQYATSIKDTAGVLVITE